MKIFTKNLLIAPLVAGSLMASGFAATDNKDDISYSVGYTMGKTLAQQMNQVNVSVDKQEITNGIKDGINGKEPKLTQDQMQSAMMEFQKQVMAAAQKK